MKKNNLNFPLKVLFIFSLIIVTCLFSGISWASDIKGSIIKLDSLDKGKQSLDIDHRLLKALKIIDDMDETKKWAEIKKLINLERFKYSRYFDELIYLYTAHSSNLSDTSEFDFLWEKMSSIQDSVHFFPLMLIRFFAQNKTSPAGAKSEKELNRIFKFLELTPKERIIHGPAIEGNILFGYTIKENFSESLLPKIYSLKDYLKSAIPLDSFSEFADYVSLLEESKKRSFNPDRLETLAELYEKKGDKQKAAQNYFELSAYFNKSGNNKKANELIKKAYKNNPIDKKIDDLKSEIELALVLKEKTAEADITHPAILEEKKTKKISKHAGDSSYRGMVAITGGCFMMGAPDNAVYAEPDEKPAHEVCLNSFLMDRYEVTNEKYKKFLDENPGYPIPTNLDSTYNYWNGRKPIEKFHNKPVINVSWQDADNFCRYEGKRLPTEAEWEYAARGGSDKFNYPWGNEDPRPGSAKGSGANFNNSWRQGDGLDAVGIYEPNGYGLYDMAGNVWEWVYDYYSPQYYKESPKYNPVTHNSGKCCVVRGGSWFSKDATHLRTANRFWIEDKPNTSLRSVGFRCVKGLNIKEQSVRKTEASRKLDEDMTRTSEFDKKAVESFIKGDINGAIDIWKDAMSLAILPELGQTAAAGVLNNLGFAYYKLYMKEKEKTSYSLAQTYLEDSLLSAPRWTAYLNLGDLYFEGNEPEKALIYYETLLEIKPNYKYAKKIHKRINLIRDNF